MPEIVADPAVAILLSPDCPDPESGNINGLLLIPYQHGGQTLSARPAVEVRHVAEVLAGLTDRVPPIGEPR
jgi:hypothetical protein